MLHFVYQVCYMPLLNCLFQWWYIVCWDLVKNISQKSVRWFYSELCNIKKYCSVSLWTSVKDREQISAFIIWVNALLLWWILLPVIHSMNVSSFHKSESMWLIMIVWNSEENGNKISHFKHHELYAGWYRVIIITSDYFNCTKHYWQNQ